MTGNKNAWRAPLAGLASVAMIATMGVAAGTANAADAFKVTLDANGGAVQDSATFELADNDGKNDDGKFTNLYQIVASAKEDGATKGKTFTGWYTSKSAGQAVGPETVLTDGQTLYAHWTTNQKTDAKQIVTFTDADEVAADVVWTAADDQTKLLLADGDTAADWQVPSKDNAANSTLLTGWKTADGTVVSDFTKVQKGTVLYPVSVAAVKATFTSGNFDMVWAADGKVVDASNNTVKVAKNSSYGQAPVAYGATKSDPKSYSIVSQWADSSVPDDKKTAFDFSKADSDVTLVPFQNGTKAYKVNVTAKAFYADGTQATAPSFDLGHALVPAVDNAAVDTANLKAFETVDGYTFEGWYTDAELKTKLSSTLDLSYALDIQHNETTLYAKYSTAKATQTKEVTFDPYYDGATPIVKNIAVNEKWGDQLPTVTRDGYRFIGWYTTPAPTADNKPLSADGIYAGDFTYFYAAWESSDIADLKDLLNLRNPGDEDKKVYTKASWTNYEAVRKDVVKKAFGTDKVQDSYTVADIKALNLSDEDLEDYLSALQDAKAKLQYTAEIAGLFTDVKIGDEDNHASAVLSLGSQGIIKGFANGDGTFSFRGLATIKRQDFAAFLYRLAGEPAFDESEAEVTFTDVTAGDEANHSKAVLWAADKGIIKGYANGDGTFSFRGLATIKRQDAAAFLYRAAGEPEFDEDTVATFADVAANDEANHSKAVLWAASEGIVKGYGDNTFRGMNTIIRQDAAAFLYRAQAQLKFIDVR